MPSRLGPQLPVLPSPPAQRPPPIPDLWTRSFHHLHLQSRFPYLNDDPARTVFEQTLKTLLSHYSFYVFGYVLVPNHVHLLLSEQKHHLVADILRAFKTGTSKKLKNGRRYFCRPRYYDRNIVTQPEFTEKLRYIHRNPVEEGLIGHPDDWPWSRH